MLKKFYIFALAALCLLSVQLGAAEFHVAKQGKALCAIETGKNPDAVVRLAAQELQHWIKEITGAAPEIWETAQGSKIVLAVNDSVKELRGNDGYAVSSGDGVFRITGSCPKGVLNGVCQTLYRTGNVIWARPEPGIGTIVRKKADLSFDAQERTEVPAFLQRGWQMEGGKQYQEINSLWLARNSVNWMTGSLENRRKYGCILEFGGGHNICTLYLPEKLYFKDHPDFYPEIHGKRVRPSAYHMSTQLCFTNPAMLKEFRKRLDGFVKANPDFQVYRVMLQDNYVLCTCKSCMEPLTLPDGSVLDGRKLKVQSKEWKVWRSTQFFLWYNALAKFMKEKYPEKRLLSFAYFFTEFAPKIKVMDNVDISFCPIYRDSKYPVSHEKNKEVLASVDEWLEQTPCVTWREYYGLNVEYPRPIDRMAFSDFALLAEKGIKKTYSELVADVPVRGKRLCGQTVWDLGAPYLWSLVQAPWNPNRKVEEVRREYYERVFGKEAAPAVEALYNLIEKAWYDNPRKSVWKDNSRQLWSECYFRAGIDKECLKLLAEALKKTDTPQGKEMLIRLQKLLSSQGCQKAAAPVVIPKTADEVTFDPELSSPVWSKALTITEFFDEDGKPCQFPTTVKLLHDGKNIYAAMKAQRPGLRKMLVKKNKHSQVETFDLYFQLTDEKFPDYVHMMADPLNRIYVSAADNRQLKKFKWQRKVQCNEDSWSAFYIIPRKQLAKKLTVGCFRRYEKSGRPGVWPSHGAGQKNAVMHCVGTFSPATLAK